VADFEPPTSNIQHPEKLQSAKSQSPSPKSQTNPNNQKPNPKGEVITDFTDFTDKRGDTELHD